jgi:iron complex outermembrane receptor protein
MHAAGEVSKKVLSGSNQHRRQTLMAGFLRAEYNFDDLPLLLSAGYGHAERAADYWEVYSFDGIALDAEENNEFDIELSYDTDNLSAKLSAFYSHISDFILVRGTSTSLLGTNNLAANIDAQRVGGELSLAYALTDHLTVLGDVSYTYGENLTQNTPLAQTPPLEGNIGLSYKQGPFSGQINTRLVNAQSRIHATYGNILSVDSTPSPGFVTASLELGYKPHPLINVKFGIDNLFNKNYSEHISRNAAANSLGFNISSGLKINEPGRAFWGRVSIDFDYPQSF